MKISKFLVDESLSDKLSIRHHVFQMIQNHLTMVEEYISGDNKSKVVDYNISRENKSSDSIGYIIVCRYVSSKTYDLKDLIKTNISISKWGISIYYRLAKNYYPTNDETADEVSVYIAFKEMDYEEEVFVKEIKARLLALVEGDNDILKTGEE